MLIIGLGGIGSQVAQRAAAFGMRVLGVDPKDIPLSRDVEKVVVPDQFAPSPARSRRGGELRAPYAASEGMLGAAEFAAMKDGVYVVNVSRGKVIRTDALWGPAIGQGPGRRPGRHRSGTASWRPPPLEDGQRHHHAPRGDPIRPVGRAAHNLIRDNIERFATGRTLRHIVDKAAGY